MKMSDKATVRDMQTEILLSVGYSMASIVVLLIHLGRGEERVFPKWEIGFVMGATVLIRVTIFMTQHPIETVRQQRRENCIVAMFVLFCLMTVVATIIDIVGCFSVFPLPCYVERVPAVISVFVLLYNIVEYGLLSYLNFYRRGRRDRSGVQEERVQRLFGRIQYF